MKCLHQHHINEDKWDCTHYSPPVVDWLNLKLLQLIDALRGSRT
jgi:hypothetical protein